MLEVGESLEEGEMKMLSIVLMRRGCPKQDRNLNAVQMCLCNRFGKNFSSEGPQKFKITT